MLTMDGMSFGDSSDSGSLLGIDADDLSSHTSHSQHSGVPSLIQGQSRETIHLTFGSEGTHSIDVDILTDAMKGCGGNLWPAAQVLARYLVSKGDNSLGCKTVVEIGSGTGLVGLVAAKLGGKVWITDQSPLLEIMQRNVELNGLTSSVSVAELNWGEPLPEGIPRPDVLLAADCVYSEPTFPLLVRTLSDLVDAGTTALFAYEKRRKADKRFFSMLKKKFRWEEVHDDSIHAMYKGKLIRLFSLET